MKKCSEAMTKDPVTALRSDTADKVAMLMKTEDIGPVPIVEHPQSKRLIGVVTDRDLALRVVAEGRDPSHTTVEEIMTRDLVTCHPDDEIRKALDIMGQHQVRRLPIVDKDNRIVGIIAQADVATRLKEPKKVAAVVEEISRPNKIA